MSARGASKKVSIRVDEQEYLLICEVQRLVHRLGTDKVSNITLLDIDEKDFHHGKLTKSAAVRISTQYLLNTLQSRRYDR